ncbi:MAG TPA: hypothetical protein VE177_03775, partial [Candidatus Binatus sp.]|nr:hypothetical protein [Candidatus Binatus sp.]
MNEISVTTDFLALATSSIALLFVARLKSTYFLGSRFFIGLANLAFIIIIVQSSAVDTGLITDSRRLYFAMISASVV